MAESKIHGVRVHVVGSGLAGSEAAHYLASRGVQVVLHEMRPEKKTEAHKTGECAELVCSNSLKSKDPGSAPGMLKAEMSRVGSLILDSAALGVLYIEPDYDLTDDVLLALAKGED